MAMQNLKNEVGGLG